MDSSFLHSSLTNPTLLFFLLGVVATLVRSDLEIPAPSVKFISLYLLFAIGFKGGQELQHSQISSDIIYAILLGIAIAAWTPFCAFFILRRRLDVSNAGAVAAAYGSVSAVTFVAAVTFLEMQSVTFGGYMVAVMAFMEFPAIVMGVVLIRSREKDSRELVRMGDVVKHAFTNGSVLMLMGSLLIGILSDSRQAEGIKPFTTDIFKGFLAIFLLEMGMLTAKRFAAFRRHGWFLIVFAILFPLVNGCLVAWISGFVTPGQGDRLIFSILAASASYIAVPAAMRLAAPKADPGIYIPMALGVTFPFNITVGMPLYYFIVQHC
jgi:hypothetical protein